MSRDADRTPDDVRTPEEPKKISRRTLITGALAAAGAGAAGAISVAAQGAGVKPGGGTIPYRLPKGAMTYLDRKEYIHNMEIVSYTPGITISGGEPLMNLWARGKQRLLPGGGGWLDISDPKKPVIPRPPRARPAACTRAARAA